MHTILHIQAHTTTITLNTNEHTLNLGATTLAQRHFHHNPPRESEWENAIMTVEDCIAPFRALLPQPSELILLHQPALQALADSQQIVYQSVIEQAFQHISRYGHQHNLPNHLTFFAQLLMVREWMHHMGFQSAQLQNA